MRTYQIAAIPADGIGPEVIEAGAEVLAALGQRAGDVDFKLTFFDWGSERYKKHGEMMPSDGLEQLKPFDAIYFGAVGALGVFQPAAPHLDRQGRAADRQRVRLLGTGAARGIQQGGRQGLKVGIVAHVGQPS